MAACGTRKLLVSTSFQLRCVSNSSTLQYYNHHKQSAVPETETTMKPTEHLSRNTEAVADTLAAMIEREFSACSCSSRVGYLDPSYPKMVTSSDRTKVVDWCYDIVDHCQLSRATVASAMEMVDRFLSLPSNSADAACVSDEALGDHSKFQLLTVTALYISIKLNEQVVIPSDQFSSEVCHNVYSTKEIEDMERTLLSGLSWRCHAPTAHQVGLSILSLILPYVDIREETWGFVIDEMKYLTELAVRDYYFSTQRTSTIALAAILNVIGGMTPTLKDLLITYLRVIAEGYDFDPPKQVAAAIKRLRFLSKMPELLEDTDERGLDDSVKTCKVSNTSSTHRGNRDPEDSLFSCKKDASGNVRNKSPRSSLCDVTGWSDQDLDDHLSCNDL